jgi:hypothetical protein
MTPDQILALLGVGVGTFIGGFAGAFLAQWFLAQRSGR